MAINFHPKAGMVLSCDFNGSVAPEITKTRPVVVITPDHVRRARLSAVVPLSTTRPHVVCAYHVLLSRTAFRGAAQEVWAKCDLAMSVSYARLDRIQVRPGEFVVGSVSRDELQQIYLAVGHAFGIDLRERRR